MGAELRTWSVIASILLVTGAPTRAWGQATSGSISGRITDLFGALVAGATVTATSERTGLARTATTTRDGEYLLASVPPDRYAVTATLQGFKAAQRTGLEISVDQALRVNFTLDVGELTDVVTVTAAAPLLQTQSASTGEMIDQRQIQDLPLLGRNFLELARLTAGTTAGGGGNPLDLSVNGQREFGNSVVVDGVEVTGNRNNDANVRPSIDAVQEFKVVTSAYAPEFGRAAGGVVAIQTRSGSNEWHGSLSEFYRPSGTAARSFFSSTGPGLRQHNFAGTLGGPIRRNRTFFFAAYEGLRHRNRFSYLDSVPPRGQIQVRPNGDVDLSGLVDPSTGRMIPIFDPQVFAETQVPQQFAGNVIPASRVSPAGLAILQQLFPEPNRAGLLNGWLNNYAVEQMFEQNVHTGDGRIDHAFRDADRLALVYHVSRFTSATGDRFAGAIPIEGGGDGDAGDDVTSASDSVAAAWTRAFRGSAVLEARASYSRFRFDERSLVPSGDLAGRLGLQNIHVPAHEATDGLPAVFLGSGAYTGGSTFKPLRYQDDNVQVTSHVALPVAGHDLKAGIDVRRLRARAEFSLFPTGSLFFGGPGLSLTADPYFGYFDPDAFFSNGGSDIADLLLGLPATVTRGLQFTRPETRSWEGHAYFQDTWRATSALTLMYGARYEYQAPFAEADDQAANFDPAGLRMLLAGRGPHPSGLVRPDRNNVAPRLGFAWQFASHSVLRGGWGLFYSPENDGRSDVLTKNYPFAVREDFVNSLYDGLPFRYVLDTGVPRQADADVPAGDAIPLADVDNARNQAFFYVDPAFRVGRAQLFNLVLQRELSPTVSIEAGYVGSIGRDMPYGVGNLNVNGRLSNDVGRIEAQFPQGRSEYHSLQAKVTRRFSRGLSLLAAYTYGKSLDNGPAPFNLGRNNQAPQDPFNLDAEWGPAGNDIRHNLVGSFLYELPFTGTGVVARLLGGWQVNGIVNARSGLPVNVIRNGGNQLAPGLRPNLVGDPELPRGERELGRYFDTSAFSADGLAADAPGSAGRNILRGPGFVNLDLSVFKSFRLTGSVSAQARVEAFNVTNTPHFANPNADLSRANFGVVSNTTGNPRLMQFALRLLF